MSDEATTTEEIARRARAFLDEFHDDKRWDSEFTPSPHSPFGKLEELCALGPGVAPVLRDYLTSTDRELRALGCYGLQRLGAAAGKEAVAWLEPLLADEWCGASAAQAIAAIEPERFWALGLQRFREAVRALMTEQLKTAGGHELLGRLVALDEEAPLLAALEAIDGFVTYTGRDRPPDAAFVTLLRRVAHSRHAQVRARVTYLLSRLPAASPAEALIEGMATSGHLGALERVAWHEDSALLVRLAAAKQHLDWLAELLLRRRCAGLRTDGEPFVALVAEKLRNPARPWRFEQHEAAAAARCAFELGDARLLPALVAAVNPQNTGMAWEPLLLALRVYGAAAVSALEVRAAGASGPAYEPVRWALAAFTSPPVDWLAAGDRAFVSGSIDHTTGGAFEQYARALRFAPSAHAAVQLAWIDRAFGVPITPARLAWLRGLGCRDALLLGELERPVTPLEGGRFEWRKCEPKDAARVAAAGLPGLAFTGSRDPAHPAAARAHIARVQAACAS